MEGFALWQLSSLLLAVLAICPLPHSPLEDQPIEGSAKKGLARRDRASERSLTLLLRHLRTRGILSMPMDNLWFS